MMARFIEFLQIEYRVSTQRVLVSCALSLFCSRFAQSQTVQHLPLQSKLPLYQWAASTDKARLNKDYLLLKPRETRSIALRSGALLRLWFTSSDPQKCDVSLQNGVRDIALLRNGRATVGELFAKAWTIYPQNDASPNARALRNLKLQMGDKPTENAVIPSYLTVTNRSNAEMKFYYQAAIREEKRASKIATLLSPKTSQIASEWTLQPNASREFATNAKGTIEDIQISFDASDLRSSTRSLTDSEVLNGVRLQARWNDEKQLAVDATLAQLAGGWRDATIPNSSVATVEKNKITLRWPMPLPTKYRLSLRNDSAQAINFYILTSVRQKENGDATSLFHAREGGESTVEGKTIPILKARGSGALVGLNLDMRPQPNAKRQTFVFLEGNEIIRADNRVLEGTGTEDFFNSAWYFPDKSFARDFHGMTRKTLAPPGVTAYRWLVPDAIPFRNSLDFQFGHSGRNITNNMDYRWVAFWYQNAGGTFQIENRIQRAVSLVENKQTSEPFLPRFIKFLPYAFLVIGTLLWLRMSWRRNEKSEQ